MKAKSPQHRRGPLKSATIRKRNNLTFRARDALKADLAASAEANQRSLSEEIEHRLENSFVYERVIGDVEDFRRRAIAAEARQHGYGTLHTPEGARHFAPGTHNLPQSGFVSPAEAAAPLPPPGLPKFSSSGRELPKMAAKADQAQKGGRHRKPSLARTIRTAKKLGATSVTTPDGFTLRFDGPASKEPTNPWLSPEAEKKH
jgi:hypothetical protein